MVRCVVRPSITRTTQLGWLDFWSLVLLQCQDGTRAATFRSLPAIRPHSMAHARFWYETPRPAAVFEAQRSEQSGFFHITLLL